MYVKVSRDTEGNHVLENSKGTKIALKDTQLIRKFLNVDDISQVGLERTVSQARAKIKESLDRGKEGVTCETCNQYVKVYKRRVYPNMAFLLKYFHREYGFEIFHLEDESRKYGWDKSLTQLFSLLKFWDLVEQIPGKNLRTGSSHKGEYRVTLKGMNFIKGIVKIKKYLAIYNDKIYTGIDFKGGDVDINWCLKSKKYDYNEMMNRDPKDFGHGKI